MKSKKVIMINSRNPIIIKMLTSALCGDEYDIVVKNAKCAEIISEIMQVKPSVVPIWGITEADQILGCVGECRDIDSKSFFVVITCYRDVFSLLGECLPGNAYPVLEPVSADLLKDIIWEAAEGEISFEHK